MGRKAFVGIFGGGALLLFGAGVAVISLRDGGHAIDPNDPTQVSLGRTVYEQNCASCHGANLEGQPNWRTRRPDGRLPAPPHDSSGHTWHHPDDVLFNITKQGIEAHAPPGYQSDMPPFREVLTDDEIRAVLAYLKSTWPPGILARQQEITRRSASN